MRHRSGRGFTLVEVLVALMVVAMGLAALMTTVSSAARASGYLRDKTLAQWIALNRLTEVRLTVNKLGGQNTDAGEVEFANRTWHYDTRYFDTSIAGMKRVVVRVYEGGAKTKGNPTAEFSTFLGASLAIAGSSNVDWTAGTTATPCASAPGASTPGASALGTAPGGAAANPCTPAGNSAAAPLSTPQTGTGTPQTGTGTGPITPK